MTKGVNRPVEPEALHAATYWVRMIADGGYGDASIKAKHALAALARLADSSPNVAAVANARRPKRD